MQWEDAKKKIMKNIKKGVDLNTQRSTYRKVKCIDSKGIRVQIGEKNSIFIKWDLFRSVIYKLGDKDGFNSKAFSSINPGRYNSHPCYVHTIGQIFVKSKLAVLDDNTYRRAV